MYTMYTKPPATSVKFYQKISSIHNQSDSLQSKWQISSSTLCIFFCFFFEIVFLCIDVVFRDVAGGPDVLCTSLCPVPGVVCRSGHNLRRLSLVEPCLRVRLRGWRGQGPVKGDRSGGRPRIMILDLTLNTPRSKVFGLSCTLMLITWPSVHGSVPDRHTTRRIPGGEI